MAEEVQVRRERPVLPARRTLLIGLGSNGMEICDRVIQRVEWEFQKWGQVPWVQVLGIETNSGTSYLPQEDRLLITLNDADFQSLTTNMGAYYESMRLSEWSRPETIRAVNSVISGAANLRMVGRIAFLFPKNFNRVREAVVERLNVLNTLDAAEATEKFGRSLDGEEYQIDFGDEGGRRYIEVYLVGTLCGGTCSGAFLDFAYMLREIVLDGGYSARQNAILTLPHLASENEHLVANAYSALRELNHYSSPHNSYEQQLPHKPGTITQNDRPPFDYVYLVSTTGISDEERVRLNTAVSQYLYAKLFLQGYNELDASRVNADSALTGSSKYGACQSYLTFGIASFEYPADQVLRACTARLCHEALSSWLKEGEVLPGKIDAKIQDELSFDVTKIAKMLIESGPEPLIARIERAVSKAARLVLLNSGPLLEFEKQMDQIFDSAKGFAKPPDEFRKAEVYEIVVENVDEVYRNIAETLTKVLGDTLFNESVGDRVGGAYEARCFLEGLRGRLHSRLAEIGGEGERSRTQSLADQALRKLNAIKSDLDVAATDQVVLWSLLRPTAIGKYCKEYVKFAKGYYERRIDVTVEQVGERLLYKKLLDMVERLLERLKGEFGLMAQARLLARQLKEEDERLSTERPEIFGIAYFTPNETVDEEYKEAFEKLGEPGSDFHMAGRPEVQVRRAAYRTIIECLRGWLEDLTLEGRSYFDAPSSTDEQRLRREQPRRKDKEAIIAGGERLMRNVLKRSVLELLHRQMDPYAELKKVRDQSELLLRVNINDDQHYETGNKSWAYLFAPKADQWQEVQKALDKCRELNMKGCETKDPRRVVFVRERAGFPLGVVEGLSTTMRQYEEKWEKFARDTNAFTFTRQDVAWDDIVRSRDHRQRQLEAEQIFLVAVACGLIQFTPGRFQYCPGSGGQPEAFPICLHAAARKLVQNHSLREDLRRAVDNKQRTHQAPHFVEKFLGGFLQTFGTYGIKRLRTPLTEDYVKDRFYEYCRQAEDLRTEWEKSNPVASLELEKLWKEAGSALPYTDRKAPVNGLYCPGHVDQPCGQLLLQANSLDYASENKDKLPRTCPNCNKWIRSER